MSPVLITGIGQRAGEYLARQFAERGVPVIGTYRTPRPSLERSAQLGIELVHADFQVPNGAAALAAQITDKHERLSAVIHNASAWALDGELDELPDTIQTMMQVHVTAPFVLNTALAPQLKAHAAGKGAAHIVHIGDYVSSRGSAKHAAYAASKAAQDNLTLSFAAKFAPHILVNSIAPALLAFNAGDEEAYRTKALDKSLLKREGGYDALLEAIDFLLTSRFITGRILPLDGGRHLR